MSSLTQVFIEQPFLFYAVVGILGLVVGSFLNVVIYRLPLIMQYNWRRECAELLECQDKINEEEKKLGLAFPASHCPHCKHSIGLLENIPVLSYLIQGGRCKHCGKKISLRYPLVEIASLILSVCVAVYFGPSIQTAGALLLTWALLALSLIDFDQQLLPDSITLPLLWLGICFNFFTVYTPLEAAILGAIFGYLALWSVYWLFKLATGKEGMGYGDFKLFALLGAWLGWHLLPAILIFSSLVGAIVGITIIVLQGRDKNIPIPFGPYLASAGWLALLWGNNVTQAYLSWAII